MSGNPLHNIVSILSLANILPQYFKEKFFNIFHIVDAWNYQIKVVFIPSWVSCIDDYMSICNNKLTCPGWMLPPRNTHTKEIITILCDAER